MTAIESTALKEWAVLVEALARGDIMALIRKGGIREHRAGFSVRHNRFLFYPTYFHEKEAELAERFRPSLAGAHERKPAEGQVRLELLADVLAVWRVSELERLRSVGDEHGLSWPAVESRFRYRDLPQVHVIAVRVSRLAAPVVIPEARRYLGCVSWVKLDDLVALDGAVALHDDAALTSRVQRMTASLGEPLGEGTVHDAQRAGDVPTRL